MGSSRQQVKHLASIGSQARGFTLIELMVAMAIVGVLVALSYPSYMDYVRKGNRAAAQAFMMEAAQRQQQHLLNNRSYAATLDDLGVSVPEEVAKHYSVTGFTITSSPSAFVLTLTPLSGGYQTIDGALCLANTGERLRFCNDATLEVSW